MMHGWGMGGFGMGFPIFGLFPLLFVGGALYLLFRRRGGLKRIAERPGTSDADSGRTSPAQPSRVSQVFRLARERNGILTVSDVVSELDLEPSEAETLLDELSDGLRVQMSVDDDGIVRYVFREFRG